MASETGKQRSQRIQIDYYRRSTGLHRLKHACVAAGLLGASAYAIYVLAWGGESQVSTGKLAVPHASFESDCQQCHQDWTPIARNASTLQWNMVGVSPEVSIQHIESACQACHRVGNHHRESMKADGKLHDKNCAGCHVEHQGREHDLALVASQKCVDCHKSLANTCIDTPTVRESVVGFTLDQHGDFSSLQQGDPGVVKFDHQQHLLPGQVDAGKKGAFTLEMLDASLRERYRKPGQMDSNSVTLDCASCHRVSGDPTTSGAPYIDSERGRYIEPISFEEHCVACHAMNPQVATENSLPLPHAVPWTKIDLLLAASIGGSRMTGDARKPRDNTRATPKPGEGIGGEHAAMTRVLQAELDVARQRVVAQCLKCHDSESITDAAIATSIAATNSPMIPARWLGHGTYDHGAHLAIDCRYCHETAFENSTQSRPPDDNETVMIAGIDHCVGCHRDAESPTPNSITNPEVQSLLGGQPTWASDNCTLCHRYHTHMEFQSEASP